MSEFITSLYSMKEKGRNVAMMYREKVMLLNIYKWPLKNNGNSVSKGPDSHVSPLIFLL